MQTNHLLYFTSDHLAFFDEESARNHAANLPDNAVVTMDDTDIDAAVGKLNLDEWSDTDDLDF